MNPLWLVNSDSGFSHLLFTLMIVLSSVISVILSFLFKDTSMDESPLFKEV